MIKEQTKICGKCKVEKPISKFSRQTASKDGFHSICKACDSSRGRERYSINRHKFRARAKEQYKNDPLSNRRSRLKHRFGITLEQYNKMLYEQGEVCAVCGKEATHCNQYRVKRLSVDHNHKTGKVRGLLCCHCNTALGYVKDKISILQSLINYLRKYQD